MRHDMNEKTFDVWITKYALTDGITKKRAYVCSGISDEMISIPGSGLEFYHGKDWHSTYEAAKERAEVMRLKKIASIEKQLSKLLAMRFPDEEPGA